MKNNNYQFYLSVFYSINRHTNAKVAYCVDECSHQHLKIALSYNSKTNWSLFIFLNDSSCEPNSLDLITHTRLDNLVYSNICRKRKRGREIRQNRVELVTDETGVESMTPVESNGTPPHLHFQANNTWQCFTAFEDSEFYY